MGQNLSEEFKDFGVFGEGNSMPDGVAFSLNKQNRWELPEVIESIIDHKTTGDDYGIQLVVSGSGRRTRCTRVCTSDGIASAESYNPDQRVISKSRGYFNADNALQPASPPKYKRRKRRMSNRNHENELDSQRDQIKYEVVRPAERANYVLKDDARAVYSHWNSPKRSRRRKHNQQEYLDCLPADLDFQDDEDCSDIEVMDDAWYNSESRDVMTEDNLNIDTDNSIGEDVDESVTPVILNESDITAQTLFQQFGQCYSECRCLPRKFILDISEKLELAMGCDENVSLNDKVYLVFEHDIDNQVNTEEQVVYLVSLRSPFCENITALFAFMDTTVDEIIERTLFSLDSLLCLANTTIHTGDTDKTIPTMVEQSFDWETTSYRSDNVLVLKNLVAEETVDKSDENTESDCDFEMVGIEDSCHIAEPTACPICCIMIETPGSGTTLLACGHTFCNECIKTYVQTEINNGRPSIKCPEFGCKSHVDPITLFALLSYSELTKFAHIVHDLQVLRKPGTLWCPSKRCGRVLKVNVTDADMAHCPCGSKTCCKCSESSHWPADCDTVREHNQKLCRSGDKRLMETAVYSTYKVYVKKCPYCRAFIEKHHGCNLMTCHCGNLFCWGCGLPWSECNQYGACDADHQDRHRTVKQIFTSFDLDFIGKRDKWYKKAMQCRLNVHSTKLAVMETSAKHLIKSIRRSIGQGRKFDRVLLVITTREGKEVLEAHKVSRFFTSIVATYIEVNNVAENASMLLSTWTVVERDVDRLQRGVKELSKVSETIWDLLECDVNCAQPCKYIIQECNKVLDTASTKLKQFIEYVRELESV